MRFPAAIYKGEQSFLAIYNYFPDVSVAAPRSLEGKIKRVAHVAYARAGHERGIDVFQVDGEPEVHDLAIARVMKPNGEYGEETDRNYNIRADLIINTNPEVIRFIRDDIVKFCGTQVARNPGNTYVRYHDSLVSRTRLRRIVPERLLTPGKQEFNPYCKVGLANLDSGSGCQTGWIPGANSRFDGVFFEDFYLSPESECDYCYAKPKHKTYPKYLHEIEKQRLVDELRGQARLITGSDEIHGKPIKLVRLGKRTDFGDIASRDNLTMALETFLEEGVQAVFPTKLLEFDSEIANLLKRTKSVLLFSHGRNDIERGAVAYGATNNVRLERAVQFKEAGVNTIVYQMLYSTAEPSRDELDTIDFARKNGLRVQLLPVRYSGREVAEQQIGVSWDRLKLHQGKTYIEMPKPELEGTYYVQTGVIIPRMLHPKWMEIIGDNNGDVRLCHHNKKLTWCGDCFLGCGFTAPSTRHYVKPIDKKNRNWRTRRKHGQLKIAFRKE